MMKEYIGAMSDEEMATDRWENEGGRSQSDGSHQTLKRDAE